MGVHMSIALRNEGGGKGLMGSREGGGGRESRRMGKSVCIFVLFFSGIWRELVCRPEVEGMGETMDCRRGYFIEAGRRL